ncbi:MAG: RES family NAD+ phosphorylase, partial [Gammaproteobacteria bacterium]|nr:RES family NAD+ phosphorylase [Gammaproteobacteria bacterium]
ESTAWVNSRGENVGNFSLEGDGAAAEFEAFWSLFEQRPDRAALNWTLRVRLERVVELDFEQLERLGVRQSDYGSRDYARTQEISDALNYLGCDGLIVPSARHEGRNLVVYMQNLGPGCLVEEVEPGVFAWSDSAS